MWSLKNLTVLSTLKGNTYSISLTYLTCKHHFSYALGTLLSKIRVIWTYLCNTGTIHLITEMLSDRW